MANEDIWEALGLKKPDQPFRTEREKLYETDEEIYWTEYLVHPNGRSRAVLRNWLEKKS